MQKSRFIACKVLVGAMFFVAGAVPGQSYPTKPVRIITSDVGGGNDFAARLIAPGLSGNLGRQVVVENRAGAGGIIAIQAAAQAAPDGYSLLLYSGTMWTLPLLRDNVPYDPVRDFAPITLMVMTPQILAVHPSLPVKSVKELIALAKARPGELNFGSAGTGGANHLAAELFKSMAGIKIVHVPYKGAGAAITALVSGEVQLIFGNATAIMPLTKSLKVRPLAVTSDEQSTLFPTLPTVAAFLPGYESVSKTAIFAPARTPPPIINRLHDEIVRVLNQAEVKEKFFNAGAEVVGSSPEQLAVTMKSEMIRLSKVIKDAGIREN